MDSEVMSVLKGALVEIFPEYSTREIRPGESLRDLGANSIDRAEIIMLTMERLQLKLPLLVFAQAKNINDLVDIFHHHYTKEKSET